MLVMGPMIAIVMLSMAFNRQTAPQERNLQVLPKDISDAKLDSIMHSYSVALASDCNFCHAARVVYPGNGLDFASDANPMKENARQMMRMTIQINKTAFYFKKDVEPVYLTSVTCRTCHRGQPLPEEFH